MTSVCCKKETSLMRYEGCTYHGCRIECLGGSWKLSYLANLAVEGSPPGSTASPAIVFWVGLQYWV